MTHKDFRNSAALLAIVASACVAIGLHVDKNFFAFAVFAALLSIGFMIRHGSDE